MSGNFEHRTRRSRSPSDDYSKRSLLTKVDKSELTKIRVAIKRANMIGPCSNTNTLDRTIDDPLKICALVHVRKGLPPRMPIFSKGIKVNQDFCEDRQVFTSRKSRSRSRSRSYRRRSRSRSRGRSSSRRRRSRSKYRSRDRSRSYEYKRKKYRSLSRSRSRSPSKHKKNCIMYRSPERSRSKSDRKRSITPLRPGEYRPGHPDLALRSKIRRSRSRSRSPRRDNMPSTSRRSRDREPQDKAYRSNSPYGERYYKGIHRLHPNMQQGIDYGFYNGFGPMPMHPQFRGRIPMMHPHMLPRMFPPNVFMPRMSPRIPYRPRWPNYNSEQEAKSNPELNVDYNKEPIITEPAESEGETKKNETLVSAVSSSKSEEDDGQNN
ncbi:serine/arginine-rich splicing factor 4-like [Anthonomus grandis grandis]|uniref:serine/arginine-rich splicing factor 4-like n=1 Tax=Anthonomus grandis grandis TaxID=2921223 RepID=UPI002165E92C|nr:serine/arginine-rich splicing factor 4-like [Anthonomus grandis grandis]